MSTAPSLSNQPWEAVAQELGMEVVESRLMCKEEKRVRSILATQKKLYKSEKRKCERAESAKKDAEAEAAQLRATMHNMEQAHEELKKTHVSLDTLEEIVACGICWDICWRPALLRCGHCFCEGCLRNHFQTTYERAFMEYSVLDTVYTCPTCRQAHIVTRAPETCFILKGLAEKVGLLRGREAPPPPVVEEGRGLWWPFF
ncbi:hypothetical protein PENSPDRAFT_693603 [Peniophora sp. CONT]|nr:hypothetical protein PENSPDRAFT_693603 [Peniophora sp. CONT]